MYVFSSILDGYILWSLYLHHVDIWIVTVNIFIVWLVWHWSWFRHRGYGFNDPNGPSICAFVMIPWFCKFDCFNFANLIDRLCHVEFHRRWSLMLILLNILHTISWLHAVFCNKKNIVHKIVLVCCKILLNQRTHTYRQWNYHRTDMSKS